MRLYALIRLVYSVISQLLDSWLKGYHSILGWYQSKFGFAAVVSQLRLLSLVSSLEMC